MGVAEAHIRSTVVVSVRGEGACPQSISLNAVLHAMNQDVLHFSAGTTSFTPWASDTPGTQIGRLVGVSHSQTMGAGYFHIDGDSIEWTVLYDEVLVVTAGEFRLRLADRVIEGRAGDVIWIPKGTSVVYEGNGAKFVYVLYPVNWRALSSQATPDQRPSTPA
jgi:ethanolamine utilization protein EutQ